MQFSPLNPIVKLCLQGMELEAKKETEAAGRIFIQAWDESTNDFEQFLAAYYIARQQKDNADKLKWLETGLALALKINDDSVHGAIATLYVQIADCYKVMGDTDKAKKMLELSQVINTHISDQGPFYHGTRADLKVGDQLTAGFNSNYKSELTMNHIYFTALVNGAGLAAALAQGDGPERVYMVEPTGQFEHDPNVTNKKFPGNPTRSYRTQLPLRIIGEVTEWARQTPEDIHKWREKLANTKGEIIN